MQRQLKEAASAPKRQENMASLRERAASLFTNGMQNGLRYIFMSVEMLCERGE